jgi:ATP-dependent Lon protease
MDLEERLALVNKPPIEEIVHFDLVNKPPIDELYHYGIMGMKWGIRRYQNPDGTLTPEGKRRQIIKDNLREKKAAKVHMKEVNKDRKRRENFERRKAAIAKDPDRLRKNLDLFTDDEIQSAIKRIEWSNKISDLNNSKIEKGKIKADKILSYGDTLNSILNFVNSPVGRGVRGAMGLSTEKYFDFKQRDDIANEIAKKQALRDAGFDTKNKNPEEYTEEELEKLLAKKRARK